MYSKFEALLKQRGTSAYKVSKETGVSQSTLSDWKRGVSKPKEDKIRKIAEYFNKPISYFYDEEEKEKPTEDDGLSENIKALMDFAKTVPEDKAELVLKLMRTIVEDD